MSDHAEMMTVSLNTMKNFLVDIKEHRKYLDYLAVTNVIKM